MNEQRLAAEICRVLLAWCGILLATRVLDHVRDGDLSVPAALGAVGLTVAGGVIAYRYGQRWGRQMGWEGQ